MDADFEKQLNEKLEELKKAATPMNITRMVVKGIARTSVAFVATTLVKTYVPTESRAQQLKLMAGTYVISGMATDAAGTWAANEFNDKVEFVQSLFGKSKETPEEDPNETAEEPEPTTSTE